MSGVYIVQVHYPKGITTGYNTFKHNHDKQKRPRDQTNYYSQQTVSHSNMHSVSIYNTNTESIILCVFFGLLYSSCFSLSVYRSHQ